MSTLKPWLSGAVGPMVAALVVLALLAACGSDASEDGDAPGEPAERAPVDSVLVTRPNEDQWPTRFQHAAPEVQEAYRFAVANPDVLQYVPCYCGCVNQGHRSNNDCYIDEIRADGSVVLDPMSFG